MDSVKSMRGGYIRIRITEENDVLVLSVYNTGMPMNKDMVEKINGLTHLPISQIKEAFPDKNMDTVYLTY